MKSFNWRLASLTTAAAALAILVLNANGILDFLDLPDLPGAFSSRAFLWVMGAGIATLLLVTALFFREVRKVENLVDLISQHDRADERAVPSPDAAGTNAERAGLCPPCRTPAPAERLDGPPEPEGAAPRARAGLRRRRQELQANSRRLAAISHDIRTPMNAVLGMSELLLADTLNSRQRGYVLDIRAAARSLLATVGEISPAAPGWRPETAADGFPEAARAAVSPLAKVLVVDDNLVNLRVAQGLLHIEGVQCDVAMSGMDALRKLDAQDYSLVFMDHMMPEMDGVETAKRIRMMPRTKKAVPIVALTADVDANARELYRNAGMNDFIPKPIDKEALRRVLLRWLPGLAETPPPAE